MDKLLIKGNAKISGSVNVHGSKNAALPIMVSSLLSEKILKLSNIPNVVDVLNLTKLLYFFLVNIDCCIAISYCYLLIKFHSSNFNLFKIEFKYG